MTREDDNDTPRLTRRAVLATLGVGATSGCLRSIQSTAGRDTPDQISLSVKTVPADDDPRATRIARFLVTNLQQVGIDAKVVPMSREELLRDVLLNHSFDIYVAQHPGYRDPDFLRPLTHSMFGVELGWQNPFGYANLELDDRLERQTRQTGAARTKKLKRIQRTLVRNQPFSVVGFPESIRATRDDRYAGRDDLPVNSLPWYLSLSEQEGVGTTDATSDETATPQTTSAANETRTTDTETASEPTTFRTTLTDARPTENLNPLAIEFRGPERITSLMYDSPGRYVDGDIVPWLAESFEMTTEGSDRLVSRLRLREDLRWHDDTPLTADDVAFTFEFLQDTSMGNLSTAVPSPRFRGLTSLVESVEATSERDVRIEFGSVAEPVARRVFTVPVLPEHVWEQQTGRAMASSLNTDSAVTKALVWNNPNPVGSGPFRFVSSSVKQSVVLEPYEDHFLARDDVASPAGGFHLPTFDRLEFALVPSSGAAVELLQRGEADATASTLLPEDVSAIGRNDKLSLHVSQSSGFYHVGYNVRQAPLSNPRFRRAVARLIDKPFLVDDVFRGYASPASSPLGNDGVVPAGLRWKGQDPELPFHGSEGELEVEAARSEFEQIGYRYTKNGRLLSG
ncbi:peptide/nickel transport system substrate-binding protein [Halogranum amylolyticum]|uniref:Peptide/nickel transport system substrate-binding protein n=1 Tax=Halogranum amylolyticum TaxID=660520 RepID=A0A1H8WDV5_9EURY|nr:ABC transporter substrate-binding protein [Halogranum amylolyticum]SEP25826.1 peptide/nickel transport system substrate-binding protein [Halogranum amylolyticum]